MNPSGDTLHRDVCLQPAYVYKKGTQINNIKCVSDFPVDFHLQSCTFLTMDIIHGIRNKYGHEIRMWI